MLEDYRASSVKAALEFLKYFEINQTNSPQCPGGYDLCLLLEEKYCVFHLITSPLRVVTGSFVDDNNCRRNI